jgi:hypothetical protein
MLEDRVTVGNGKKLQRIWQKICYLKIKSTLYKVETQNDKTKTVVQNKFYSFIDSKDTNNTPQTKRFQKNLLSHVQELSCL